MLLGKEWLSQVPLPCLSLPHQPLAGLPVASCKAPAQEGKWLLGPKKGRLKFDVCLEAISDQAQR